MTTHTIDPLEICTLDREALAERKQWVRREILAHAIGRERLAEGIGIGIGIEIIDAPGVRDRIDEWIELEGDCCGGIRFERRPSAFAGRVRVEIHGVDPAGRLFDELPDLSSRSGSERGDRVSLGRVLGAGGLGTVASVFLLCVVPMGLVGVLGASAVALPLSRLDDPRWIALGAVAFAGLILWWMRRQRRAC